MRPSSKQLVVTAAVASAILLYLLAPRSSEQNPLPAPTTILSDDTAQASTAEMPMDDHSPISAQEAAEIKRKDNVVANLADTAGEKIPEQGLANAPSRDTYRADVAKNPHLPPASLIAAAKELAEHMPRARASARYAEQFFDRLLVCAKKAEVAAVRAACRDNAEELAVLHPTELRVKYAELQ